MTEDLEGLDYMDLFCKSWKKDITDMYENISKDAV